MFFASDNAGPVAPEILRALAEANDGYAMPYGNDPLSDRARTRIREVFEAPQAEVFFVPTGTAANALALGTTAKGWDTIYCHRESHIAVSEQNAAGFYTGGARLLPLDGPSGRIDAGALQAALAAGDGGGVVSLTQVTDLGAVHGIDEIAALAAMARNAGAICHMDGARFANALVALGARPAEMSWKAGVDVLSFGGTKNGLMMAEAVIFFDPALARDFGIRRLRGGHMASKQRFIAAQYLAYLADGLWLDLAGRANAAAARLEARLAPVAGLRVNHPRQANMIFAQWPRILHRRAREAGAAYYLMPESARLEGDDEAPLTARLVANWATTEAEIDRFAALLGA